MTERRKRGSAPLSAHDAVGRIRAIYADQERRIAELKAADDAKARAIVDRVDGERESDALALMLAALGINVPAGDTPPVPVDDDESDDENDEDSDAGVEYGTMPPQAEQGLPKGATEYRPGPAATAARSGRR